MEVEILGLKGQGFFCDVQRAKDKNGNKVAVKQLKREFVTNADYVQRFKREVRITNELSDSPFIIPCLEVELDDSISVYRYMMPLAEENLYKYIKSNNTKLTLEQRLSIFDQIVMGLQYAHNKEIIHRDIAPQNVLIFQDEEQNVKAMVSDFGLGKDHKSLSKLSKSAGHYGRVIYVAPEQVENIKDATFKSDIYSIGKLLLFILSGRDPVVIETGDKFSALITKATKYNSDQRHANIDEFIEQYEKLKSLYLGSPGRNLTYETLKGYVEDSKGKIDWAIFHQHVLQANVIDHVFEDFLEPIVEVLRNAENLSSYSYFAQDGIIDFMEVFSENLRTCLPTTGWPFRYLDTFGEFLYQLHSHFLDPKLQLICLKDLWEVSFEADQWGSERLMERIIRGRIHPDNIEPFAEFLMDSICIHAHKIINNGRLSEIHPIIRTALLQVVERAEDLRKKQNDMSWFGEE
ncbi:serine/threonine-protein kinase [Brevibacillus porteri]|uniref:serine/threonine-protein kinase n=1 Tax=Brevibacillus porteri TaxID=2126350 RepID=UPI003D1A36C5